MRTVTRAHHPATMRNTPPKLERWRPWSHPTPRGVDLAFAVPLFVLEIAWLVWDWIFGLGLDIWAAQGDQGQIDAAILADIGRMRALLIAVLVAAVLAGIFRARWTLITHLLVALLASGVLVATQHHGDNKNVSPPGHIYHDARC